MGGKRIFRKVWAIYGGLVFFLLWLVFFPFYLLAFLLLPKKGHRHIIWFSHHIYTRLFFGLTLVRIRVTGKDLLDKNQRYIIVSNHRSALDFMLNAYAYPWVYKFLAKRELAKVPLFGFIVKKLCVLVDRSNASSRASSINFLKNTIREGYSVFLYPEGTRNRSDQPLGTFHKGAFRIAIETDTPIATQTIVGIENISSGTRVLDYSPGVIYIHWSTPIYTGNMEGKDIPLLMNRVRNQMLESLEKEN